MVRWTEAPEEPLYDLDDDFDPEPEPRRRRRSVTFLLVLFMLAFVAYGVARVASVDNVVDSAFLAGAMAFTPYVAAACFLLTLVTFLFRRKILGLIVLVVALSLGALLGPRYFSGEQPEATGAHLRIMAVNLFVGRGDASTIVNLVRQQQVDVLTLPELTPAAVSALDDAGLRELLPYQTFDARQGGGGSGIAAKAPLRKVILTDETTLSQPSAVIDLPGRDDVELTAVHVLPPLSNGSARTWRTELTGLPRTTPNARVRILAGDFNATFDHALFRDLVDRGYADAAEETGKGLEPTWSSWPTGPPLTIDHVLVDSRCAISSYAVFDVPGSDHNAIVAEVILP